jgi:hypothetical protein
MRLELNDTGNWGRALAYLLTLWLGVIGAEAACHIGKGLCWRTPTVGRTDCERCVLAG